MEWLERTYPNRKAFELDADALREEGWAVWHVAPLPWRPLGEWRTEYEFGPPPSGWQALVYRPFKLEVVNALRWLSNLVWPPVRKAHRAVYQRPDSEL